MTTPPNPKKNSGGNLFLSAAGHQTEAEYLLQLVEEHGTGPAAASLAKKPPSLDAARGAQRHPRHGHKARAHDHTVDG